MALWEAEKRAGSSLRPAPSPIDLGRGCYFPKPPNVGDHKGQGGQQPWEGLH